MTFLVKEGSFARSNIGLVGAQTSALEELSLPSHLSPEADQGIFTKAVKGMWYEAVTGFEVGQTFCGLWGEQGDNGFVGVGHTDSTLGLALLVLCGGGIVGGTSVGAAYGLVAPLLLFPNPTEIAIARERVIQGIWGQLVRHGREQERGMPDGGGDDQNPGMKSMAVKFGIADQPYSAYMRIEPLQVGLFSKSKFDHTALTLLWNIRVIFFDSRHRTVAKPIIEIELREYHFDEWTEHEAELLKAQLMQGYQVAMEQIVGKLAAQ